MVPGSPPVWSWTRPAPGGPWPPRGAHADRGRHRPRHHRCRAACLRRRGYRPVHGLASPGLGFPSVTRASFTPSRWVADGHSSRRLRWPAGQLDQNLLAARLQARLTAAGVKPLGRQERVRIPLDLTVPDPIARTARPDRTGCAVRGRRRDGAPGDRLQHGHLAPAGARSERHRVSGRPNPRRLLGGRSGHPGESRAFAAPPTGFAHSAPCRPPHQFFELFFALHEERQRRAL